MPNRLLCRRFLSHVFVTVVTFMFFWLATQYLHAAKINANQPNRPSVNCPPNAIIGEVFDCSLSVVGEADNFSFSASTNDQLVARLLRTSGTYRPRIAIFDVNGNQICGNYSFTEVIAVACAATSSGTFTLRVDDQAGSGTGNYKVYLQKLNAVGNALPVAFGQIITGTLASAIEGDAFTLEMARDDQAILRLVRTAGNYRPQLRVYNQAGTLVCGNYTVGTPVNLEPCSITESGTYAILVDNQQLAATGDYALHIQKRNLPGSTTALQFGAPLLGTLNNVAEIDTFTFDAAQNDQILLRLAKVSGTYRPRLRVYDAAGNEVCGTYTFGDPVNIAYCSITTTGQHAVFVDDQSLTVTGDYRLFAQRINNPGNATQIRFGQTVTGDIDAVAMADTYLFTAANANLIKLTMTRTSGSYRPRLTVFDSGGKVICTNYSFNDTIELNNCAITSDGKFTILVDDQTLAGVGNYRLSLECLGEQCGSKPLVMVYTVLDNNLGDNAEDLDRLLTNIESGAHSGVDTWLMIDGPGNNDSYIFEIQPDAIPCIRLSNPTCPDNRYVKGTNFWDGDENSAHPKALYDFVQKAVGVHPVASHNILSLVGHGSGWTANALPGQPSNWTEQPSPSGPYEERIGGFLWDDLPGNGQPGNRSMSTKALGVALNWIRTATKRNIDLLYLDACSMGMAEVAYEVRDNVNYLLASPNTAWTSFAYDTMLAAVTAEQDAETIGKAWFTAEKNALDSRTSGHPYTLALYNLRNIEALAQAVNTLSVALQSAVGTQRDAMLDVFAQTERYESNYDGAINGADHYGDLGSLLKQIKQKMSANTTVTTAATVVENALSTVMVSWAFKNGSPHPYPGQQWQWNEASGMGIYLSAAVDEKQTLYTPANLAWTQTSNWHSSLNALWGVGIVQTATTTQLPTCSSTRNCTLLPEQLPVAASPSPSLGLYLPIVLR